MRKSTGCCSSCSISVRSNGLTTGYLTFAGHEIRSVNFWKLFQSGASKSSVIHDS